MKYKTRDINGNWIWVDTDTNKQTSAAPTLGTIKSNTVQSVGGDVSTRQGRTKIARNQVLSYNNRQYKVHNYADTRIRNKLSHQEVNINKETGEPEIVQADYTPGLEAPMLIVSPEFDFFTLGRQVVTSLGKAATKEATTSMMADVPTLGTLKALTLEQINEAFEGARQWHVNRISSEGWKLRAIRAGFTDEEIPLLLELLLGLIKKLLLRNPLEIFGANASINTNAGSAKLNASYMQNFIPEKGIIKQGISFLNPNMSQGQAFNTFVHEFGHGATFGLNGTETAGYKKLIADRFPLINRAVKYNNSLFPEVDAKVVLETLPLVNKNIAALAADNPKLYGYFAEPTEMLSRGYEFMLNSAAAKNKLTKTLGREPTLDEVLDLAIKWGGFNSNLFKNLAGKEGAHNFVKNALGISSPIGLGASLYGMGDNSLTVEMQKKGGKTHKPSQRSVNRPWGHRSILDNGWQSTKLLKNKKNVYGK